ncbi:MAG TPA: 50S ribosomal protein L6 [Candidatus Limnocylindria bacterium]|jgi:large subunit ribosomal protein L6|uniref:Large ribosomal subunit protein uL6 n=1 Tax=uncultured Chloroflexi bacterium Rifle_16ft_4_minimus_1380 TaxID=1665057 RepID=A0A0H4T3T3_9CHLR|nr:50S ribosomal protein L6, large subunit ribosomal protein L6 [uncultured Chloroflexi bacterium Rifle_16ft_4_minimus_1380]
MSRIGRLPIPLPAGVEVSLEGRALSVRGPLGTLEREIHPEMQLEQAAGELRVIRPTDEPRHRALHGLTRSLVANMVAGVTTGFTKGLEISGVGYRAQLQGTKLVLALGYSHPVEVDAPEGITFQVETPTRLAVFGADKELVGQTAAYIRSRRKPEPYKGKGIRYAGEVVLRKAGKAGKVGGAK